MFSFDDIGNICLLCLLVMVGFSLLGLRGAGPMIAALAVIVAVVLLLRK